MAAQAKQTAAELPKPLHPLSSKTVGFVASRDAGLVRLDAFGPKMGIAYARSRNFDFGPNASAQGQIASHYRDNVSVLSPYVRHRLVLEEELASRALELHGESASEKFVQEVIWRSYWKGWLEQRSDVWTDWLSQVETNRQTLQCDPDLQARHAQAVAGETGIACFDFWARELIETGYLHNHARMWFASIWVHTLDLPWSLGAAFFLHHLLDGDPASNTLSWRWVSGLHTKGKTYLARAENVEKFTNGRFRPEPEQLTTYPKAFDAEPEGERIPLPYFLPPQGKKRSSLLITTEDCAPEAGLLSESVMSNLEAVATVVTPANPDSVGASVSVEAFKAAALADAGKRFEQATGLKVVHLSSPDAIPAWFAGSGADQLITAYLPCGETRTALAGAFASVEASGGQMAHIVREWDSTIWPHATAGFFKVKKKIPSFLRRLNLL